MNYIHGVTKEQMRIESIESLEALASKRKHYSRNKIAKMKELANNKSPAYLREI